jgi:S-adenosylmethionine uptake transporter
MAAPPPGTTGSSPLGPLLALLGFAVYALHDVVIKHLSATYNVMQITFYAALFSLPLLAVMLIHDAQPGTLRARNPGWVALRTLGVVGSGVMGFYAFATLPMAQAYAIFFAAPLIVTLLSIPFLGERVGPRRGLAVAVGLAGVLIVLRPGFVPLSAGHGAALLAAVSTAIVAVCSRRIGREERAAVLMLWPLLANVAVMGAALPWVYVPTALVDLAGMAVIALLGFVAMLLLIAAYRRAEAAIVAPMQYSQMLWAVFYGALIFAEWPDVWTLLGGGVIIASGLYIVLRETRAGVSATRPAQGSAARPAAALAPGIDP